MSLLSSMGLTTAPDSSISYYQPNGTGSAASLAGQAAQAQAGYRGATDPTQGGSQVLGDYMQTHNLQAAPYSPPAQATNNQIANQWAQYDQNLAGQANGTPSQGINSAGSFANTPPASPVGVSATGPGVLANPPVAKVDTNVYPAGYTGYGNTSIKGPDPYPGGSSTIPLTGMTPPTTNNTINPGPANQGGVTILPQTVAPISSQQALLNLSMQTPGSQAPTNFHPVNYAAPTQGNIPAVPYKPLPANMIAPPIGRGLGTGYRPMAAAPSVYIPR